MKNKIVTFCAIGIFLLAAFFRFTGINWDANQHLHPDERFLTMVTTTISWPKNISEYLDTTLSPLNPHNKGFGFFVYGTFPIFFTKWVSEYLGKADYNGVTLIGRQLSALFDLGTVLLIFLIGKQINTNQLRKLDNWVIGLFAAFFYAASVLPIQLSHFYAVDTYLTFFITLSFYFLMKVMYSSNKLTTYNLPLTTALLGIVYGLALASKISAILFLPIIGLGLLIYLIKNKNLKSFFVLCSLFSVICYFTFRFSQPYLFTHPNIFDITLNEKVLDNWKQLKSFDDANGGFPPALQWIPTQTLSYLPLHSFLWGLGIPLGVIAVFAMSGRLLVISCRFIKQKFHLPASPAGGPLTTYNVSLNLILLWILFLTLYQSTQFAKALRYLSPVYPAVALLCGWFCATFLSQKRIPSLLRLGICIIMGISICAWTSGFMSIYTTPHTRVTASEWIYDSITPNNILTYEVWDDPLPLSLENHIAQQYTILPLEMYNPDTEEKWQILTKKIAASNYIILSSNRVWRSLSALPHRFPYTSNYYRHLFAGSLGFSLIKTVTSYPCIVPRLQPIRDDISPRTLLTPPPILFTKTDNCLLALGDDGAEESFTVYDHPKVLIFQNREKLPATELLQKIMTTP